MFLGLLYERSACPYILITQLRMNGMLCHSTALLRILSERVPRYEYESCFIGSLQSVRVHAELVSGSMYTAPAVLLFLSVSSARVALLRLVRFQS
jgi:hypothetical protein